jgi:hypothetical protein
VRYEGQGFGGQPPAGRSQRNTARCPCVESPLRVLLLSVLRGFPARILRSRIRCLAAGISSCCRVFSRSWTSVPRLGTRPPSAGVHGLVAMYSLTAIRHATTNAFSPSVACFFAFLSDCGLRIDRRVCVCLCCVTLCACVCVGAIKKALCYDRIQRVLNCQTSKYNCMCTNE